MRNTADPGTIPNDAASLVLPHVAAMGGYVPGEQPGDGRFVKLNTNENPYPPSARVREAIAAACENLALYPDPSAREVRECASEIYGVDADGVLIGNGSDELLSILVRATTAPGQSIAYPVPTYSLYDTLVELQGARSIHVPFEDDRALPAGLATADARLIFVCNPNAPSGTLIPVSALDELARRRSDAVVVIDEAYVDFADETALPLVGRVPNVVVLRTLSKSYSLAGLRIGIALTSVPLARQLHKVRDSYNVSRIAQAGALAALQDQAGMRAHVERVRATRTRLTDALRRLGFTVAPSHTNFVFAVRPGEDLAPLAAALRDRRVLVRHFTDLPDGLRITVGTEDQIDALLAALADIGATG
ncbi:MAG: histidinol-phosphate transaminase [Candidatus Binatia bacterium]|nr:histidinol-phosphate transaminase [Candidatus Binatia bacterium]